MGLLDRWRSSTTTGRHRGTNIDAVASTGYTVIDVETTGLSARHHRVLEIAVVRTDAFGRITGEWSRRVDPGGPVGATHIHGITANDVRGAPKFGDLIPHLNQWMQGAVLVAHNARFDAAFVRAEYSNAGWDLPWLPTLCTLEASSYYLPDMDRRRLADCCALARVPLRGAHSALGDARATAGLLRYYLDPRNGTAPHPDHLALAAEAAAVTWPASPTRAPRPAAAITHTQARIQINKAEKAPSTPALVQLLADFSLVDALDEGAPTTTLPYVEMLAEALEDGVVSRAERSELVDVCTLLGLPSTLLTHTLDQAEAARHERLSAGLGPLPDSWILGEPLRVGHKVAFTGCDETLRDQLERRAEALGVRVMNNVSTKTFLLVTDGTFSGGKAADAARVGCRIVHPDDFATLLQHLQPAVVRERKKVPATAPELPVEQDPGRPALVERADPAAVRQWARENGYAVGTRGRLHQDLYAAYAAYEVDDAKPAAKAAP
jgi:DNA polymerase III subunit epsilon